MGNVTNEMLDRQIVYITNTLLNSPVYVLQNLAEGSVGQILFCVILFPM